MPTTWTNQGKHESLVIAACTATGVIQPFTYSEDMFTGPSDTWVNQEKHESVIIPACTATGVIQPFTYAEDTPTTSDDWTNLSKS